MNPPPCSGEAPPGARPLGPSLSFMQLNFRRSETTWVLCQQEFLEKGASPDIILVQDPPTSVLGGKNIFQGYRIVKAPGRGQGLGQVAIVFRNSLRVRGLRPFGSRVVLAELAGVEGPIIVILAYIRYSSGEGLVDLEAALRWAKSRYP